MLGTKIKSAIIWELEVGKQGQALAFLIVGGIERELAKAVSKYIYLEAKRVTYTTNKGSVQYAA